MSQNFGIEYYETGRGTSPIDEFIDSLPKKHAAKLARFLDLLSEFGLALGRPYIAHLEEGIWELRVGFAGNKYRFLFFQESQKTFRIVHAFPKKTQKIRSQDLELARQRMKEYKGG